MKRGLFVLLMMVFTVARIDSKGIFTITMPGQFGNNPDFNVGITTQDMHEPLDVNITVFSDKFSKSFFETCEPGVPKLANLQFFDEIPKNESMYNYKVRVEDNNGIGFAQEASLGYIATTAVAMVQTDKGIYKPGDRVRMRVIYSDRKGLPVSDIKSTVYITDGKGNRIKEWKFGGNKQGVFTTDFLLSKEPVLGFWNIYVNVDDGMIKSANFKVEEYVLPKFQVTVSPSGISSFKKGKFVVIVDAKYTYGKPVKGSATLQIPHPRNYKLTQRPQPLQASARRRPPPRPIRGQNYITKVVPINGRAIVEFDIKTDFLIDEVVQYIEYISVEATVNEELTGVALKGSNSIPIYPNDYVITVSKQDASFKPGLPYRFEVQISKPDGKPYVPKRTKLQMTTFYGFNDDKGTNSSFAVDKSGKVRVTNTAPLAAVLMDFKFRFKSATASLYLTPEKSDSNSFIKARASVRRMYSTKYIFVTVISTRTLKRLFYTLYNRQEVLATREIRVKNRKFASFKFEEPYAPVSKLLIWYTTNRGEIVSDVVDIEGNRGGTVNVEFSQKEVRPGNNVDILVTPDCDRVSENFVALAVVDQSVLLLSEGNTVTQQMFNDNQQLFYTYGSYPTLPKLTDRPYSLSYYPSYSQMVDAGVIVFTNANTYKLERGFSYYNYYGGPAGPGGGGRSSARKAKTTRRGEVMAMADRAESASSSQVASAPGDSVRRDFPETWIWEDISYKCYSLDNPRKYVDKITKKVPDTITSWVLTAFANNPYNGFAALETPRTLRVFKPFFASLTLPYSIVRGEVLQVSVQVFNYLATASKITVTLENKNSEFVFMTGDEEDEDQTAKTIPISVDANAGVTVPFYIKATKIAYITLSVIARSPQAQDYLEQQLLVKPEGSPVFVNKVLFYDLRNVDSILYPVDIEVPAEAIPDYRVVELSVFGNLLGDTARNLERLIRLPSGCGEQTIAAFAPNVAVLDYLKATNALTPEVEGRAKSYMETGYQNELRYQRYDGSFSCFGESDASGSTWLTAFVVKTFSQAKRYITIDDSVLNNALNWLVNLQSENGRFNEVGRISHADAQGEGSGGAALTSFVVIAILAVPNAATTYQVQLEKATEYIAEFAGKSEDFYTLAIASYALRLAKHSSAADIYKRFDAKATVNGQFKYWEKPIPGNLQKNRWYYFTNCIDIEITAYGLLANLATDSYIQPEEGSFPIMRWLISQRNSLGGFCSTQDTVLSISALALYAERIYTKDQNVDVVVKVDDNEPLKYKITVDNPTPVTNQDLGAAKYIEAECSGTGFAIVQISYRYNVIVPEPEPAFNLEITVDGTSTASFLNVTICTSFIPTESVNSTNMALVEVPFPSGFTFNSERLPQLRTTNNVKRIELKDADTLAVLYFDYMDEREVCMALDASKTTNVSLTKPVFVKVYDYYDNSRRARKSYSAVE